MNKKHFVAAALAALTLSLTPSLVQAEPLHVTITPSSGSAPAIKMVEAHINLQPFTSISSDVVANIRFFQSDRHRIEATGPERIISAIDVKVEDGSLRITAKKNLKMKQGEKLTLTIYGQTLNSVRLDGVGNFKCPERIKTDKMEIKNDGVGNIQIDNLHCHDLYVKNEGVGNVSLRGRTDAATYMSDGVGNIRAYDLLSRTTTVNLKGVGSVQCHASERCELTNNGVGHIYYKGNPETQRIHKNGIGAISKR